MADMKIKVVVLCTGLHGLGGVLNQIINWMIHHDSGKFDLTFICVSKSRQVVDLLRKSGIPEQKLVILDREKYFFPALTIFRLIGLLKKIGPDILHTVFLQSDVIGAIVGRALGIKILISNIEGRLIPNNTGKIKEFLYYLGNKFFRKKFDKTIVVSKGIRDYLAARNQIDLSKTEVVHVGVEAIHPSAKRVEDNKKIIGSVSRLGKEKGIIYFVRSIPKVLEKFKDVSFIIASDGEEKANLVKEVHKLKIENSVEFVGWVEDISTIFNKIDVLIIPSLTEGLPLTILEAFSLGIPVVGSEVGGIPDLVENKRTGLLVPPKSPDCLADAMIELLDDPGKIMLYGKNAEMFYKNNFKIENENSKIANIYDSMVLSKRAKV